MTPLACVLCGTTLGDDEGSPDAPICDACAVAIEPDPWAEVDE